MSETKSGSVCFLRGQFWRQNMAESAMDLLDWLRRVASRRIVSRLAAAAINQTHKKGSTFVIESEFLLRIQQPNTYMFTT